MAGRRHRQGSWEDDRRRTPEALGLSHAGGEVAGSVQANEQATDRPSNGALRELGREIYIPALPR